MEGEISIEGRLLMLDDATPHVAVPVQTIHDGRVIATTLSDESGRYRFTGLEKGSYQLRCQVLGGYVYYGEERRGKRESQKSGGRGSKEAGERGDGDILRIESGSTLKDIDFRFAPFKKGIWKNYSYLDGLTDDGILAVYCDPDGVMWFGAHVGVFRYDGKEFIHFTTRDGLGHGHVHPIGRDPNGMMWFGTWGGGVSRYDGKEFVTFTTEDGLAHNIVFAIHCDMDGMMWFGTYGGGVSRYDGKTFVNFTTEDGLASNNVCAIYGEPDGVMWFGTRGGVSRYDGKEFVSFTTEDGLAHNQISANHSMHRDPDGVIWFGTNGGVSRYDGEEFVNFTTADGLADNYVPAIHSDPDGVMWFGTGGGVSRYDGKGFVNFTTEDGLAHNMVMDIHSDPDGVMWFATRGGGVSRYDPNAVHFTAKDGLAGNSVYAMHRDSNGVIWFGTDGGVSRYDGKEFIHFTTEDGLAHNSVTAIHSDQDGVMWFGTDDCGVSRYDGKEFVNFSIADGLNHSSVCIHRDPAGVMWFGIGGYTSDWLAVGGVFRYDGKEFVNLTTEAVLAQNYVNDIHREPNGIMWFATGATLVVGGLSRYDGKEFVTFTTEDGLPHNNVEVIHRDPDGVLWFGTWDGVARYDGRGMGDFAANSSRGMGDFAANSSRGMGDFPHFVNFTTEDGLVGNIVSAIHRDLDGILWFGTNSGVSGYDGAAWTSLDARDGLVGHYIGSILQDPDGFLWFAAGDGGVTRYRRSTTPPRVYVVSVTTDQTYRLKTERSSIPAFAIGTRVTIEYDSIDVKTLPEKRQFRCRVYAEKASGQGREGALGRGSIGAGGERENGMVPSPSDPSAFAYFTPTKETAFDWMPEDPGTYIFQVQAIDRDLNYSEPASVKLQVVIDPRNHRIAQLEGELAERERAELERVHQELEDARQIQQSLLPDSPPEIEGFEIAGTSIPAREVSGDFYSYLSLGSNVGIALADVTGKSVRAAMVATLADGILHTGVRERSDVWSSPGVILREVNTGLHPRLMRGMFTAMSLGILRAEERHLLFSNAGMPYPIVKRGREVCELEVPGMPLGLMDSAEYQDLDVELRSGDFVVFCSDGVIEAENGAGDMYQTERLLELIGQADPDISAKEMVDLIMGDVTAFVGAEEASDDITIVVIKCE